MWNSCSGRRGDGGRALELSPAPPPAPGLRTLRASALGPQAIEGCRPALHTHGPTGLSLSPNPTNIPVSSGFLSRKTQGLTAAIIYYTHALASLLGVG